MTLSPGLRLGPYQIVSPVGAGGMGEVYKALDTRLDRTVAIKVLPQALAADVEFRERFGREARAISQLDHAHICALYDVGEQDGISYLVMQFLEGMTLAERLRNGALPLPDALAIAVDVAEALQHAHRAGIVHRDLKPGNIMLTRGGATLLDFGVAKAGAAVVTRTHSTESAMVTAPANLTTSGSIVGTLQYMAPEQLEGGAADARSDLFAFGAVLYEMVTGRPAFAGKTRTELIAAIFSASPPPITTRPPQLAGRLEWVLTRCLAKNPEERWQSAADVKSALVWIASTEEASAAGASRHPRGVRLWQAVSAALMVAVAILLILAGRRDAAPPLAASAFTVAPPEGTTFATPLSAPIGLPWMALSPDGRVLAVVAASEGGRQQLWLRPLGGTTAHPLAGTEGARAPFWSPDSRLIGFFAQGKLKYVDAGGGAPQVLSDASWGMGGAWNRRNEILFSPTLRSGVRKVAVGGGASDVPTTRVDSSKGQYGHVWPQFLPDDRHFLYTVVKPSESGTKNEVWVGSTDADAPRMLLASDANAVYAVPGYLLYSAGGVLVARRFDPASWSLEGGPVRLADAIAWNGPHGYAPFSASSSGILVYDAATTQPETPKLAWRDRQGRQVAVGPPDSDTPALSRDGSRILVTRDLPETGINIWLYDLKRGMTERLTFGRDTSPYWSPDGRSVVFTSRRRGELDRLFRVPAAGSRSPDPLSNLDASFVTDWTADGRYIIFHSSGGAPGTAFDVWMLNAMTLEATPLVNTVFQDIYGAVSPDGRWLAYSSDESGLMEVYVRPFPSGSSKWLVSRGGGVEPRWRADGRELFYAAADDRRLMAVPVRAGSEFEAGKPVPLFDVQFEPLSVPFERRYQPSPDGQRFIIAEYPPNRPTHPLTVVVNWPALVRKERP